MPIEKFHTRVAARARSSIDLSFEVVRHHFVGFEREHCPIVGMKTTRIAFACLLAVVVAAEKLTVNVYEGATTCDEADRVKVGDQLGMHYTGTIDESSKAGEPGMQFDSSRDRDVLAAMTIGVGQVIQGWDKGLIGLCKGAKAILVVPPEMGYGPTGAGGIIPGGATLRFDVEVISVDPFPAQPNLFEELDVDEDGVLTPEEIHTHFKRADSNAELPPDLMEKEDANKDGVVSRAEFGGPRMEKEMCMEMLYHNSEPTTLGLAVRWLCQREADVAEPDSNAGILEADGKESAPRSPKSEL